MHTRSKTVHRYLWQARKKNTSISTVRDRDRIIAEAISFFWRIIRNVTRPFNYSNSVLRAGWTLLERGRRFGGATAHFWWANYFFQITPLPPPHLSPQQTRRRQEPVEFPVIYFPWGPRHHDQTSRQAHEAHLHVTHHTSHIGTSHHPTAQSKARTAVCCRITRVVNWRSNWFITRSGHAPLRFIFL